jgi:hypothetical protein
MSEDISLIATPDLILIFYFNDSINEVKTTCVINNIHLQFQNWNLFIGI